MRKLILSSALLAVATAATPLVAQTAFSAQQLVAQVQAAPDSLLTTVAAAVSANPTGVNEIVAAMIKAFPDKAAEITEAAVSALAANLPASELDVMVPNLLGAVATTLASLQSGDALNAALTDCLQASYTALTESGVSVEVATNILGSSSSAVVAAVPQADVTGAIAAPTGGPANPAIPAPPAQPLPPVSASVP